VNDYAGLLTPDERDRLESRLAHYERSTGGTQMAIAIFRSLEGEDLADVANRLFRQWRLGQKGLDNGLLLVVFVQDRKVRVEVGYGLEAVVTDALASQIIRQTIAPRFREQRYADGLMAGVDMLYARVIAGAGKTPDDLRREAESYRRSQRRHEDTASLYLILFLALFGGMVASLAWEASRQRHGITAGRGGVSRTSGGWGGGWYVGGGGGGWSSGGGGDGGFSGGGGDSGGGGASGDW
jgi:uncharacterized protein